MHEHDADLVVFLPAAGRSLDDDVLALLRRLHHTLRARGLGGLGAVEGDDDGHDLVWWVDAAAWPQAWQLLRAGLDGHGLLRWCRAVVYLAEDDARQLWPPEAPARPAGVGGRPARAAARRAPGQGPAGIDQAAHAPAGARPAAPATVTAHRPDGTQGT